MLSSTVLIEILGSSVVCTARKTFSGEVLQHKQHELHSIESKITVYIYMFFKNIVHT